MLFGLHASHKTYEATNQSNFKPRDKELLAKISFYTNNLRFAEPYRPRHRRLTHRKEGARLDRRRFPTITISITCSMTAKAIRLLASPSARMRWRGSGHRQDRQHDRVAALASNQGRKSSGSAFRPSCRQVRTIPMGLAARLYLLFQAAKDNPVPDSRPPTSRNISASRSLSGCIRLTNEDVIDLYKPGEAGHHRRGAGAEAHGDSPFKPQDGRCKPAALGGPMMQ